MKAIRFPSSRQAHSPKTGPSSGRRHTRRRQAAPPPPRGPLQKGRSRRSRSPAPPIAPSAPASPPSRRRLRTEPRRDGAPPSPSHRWGRKPPAPSGGRIEGASSGAPLPRSSFQLRPEGGQHELHLGGREPPPQPFPEAAHTLLARTDIEAASLQLPSHRGSLPRPPDKADQLLRGPPLPAPEAGSNGTLRSVIKPVPFPLPRQRAPPRRQRSFPQGVRAPRPASRPRPPRPPRALPPPPRHHPPRLRPLRRPPPPRA